MVRYFKGVYKMDKITKIDIVTRKNNFDELKEELGKIGVTGMTVTQVLGCGVQKGDMQYYRGVPMETKLIPKLKVEIVVSEVPVEKVVEVAQKVLKTGKIGDGKIFIYDVTDVIKIRTGDRGKAALQDK